MVDENTKSEYLMPDENTKEDLVHISFKMRKKLKADYFAFCETKGITVSKRLRQFMIFELKKAEAVRLVELAKIEEEKKKSIENSSESEELFDPFKDASNGFQKPNDGFQKPNDGFQKPKGLNTSVSDN